MPHRTIILVAVALAVALAGAPAATAQDGVPDRGITTVGSAAVTAPQDIARFSLTAEARRRTPAAAQSAAARTATRVITAVRRAGLAAEDVTTQSIFLSRATRRVGRRRITTYRGVQVLRVTVRDVKRSGVILAGAVRAGASGVDGPDFDVSNREALYEQALKLALRRARVKAQALAEEAGTTLGAVIRIVESEANDIAGLNALSGAADEDAGGSADVIPPVRPGRERVEASVIVTFATG